MAAMLFVCIRFADCLGIPDRLFTNISNDSLIHLVKQKQSLNRFCRFAVSNPDVVAANF